MFNQFILICVTCTDYLPTSEVYIQNHTLSIEIMLIIVTREYSATLQSVHFIVKSTHLCICYILQVLNTDKCEWSKYTHTNCILKSTQVYPIISIKDSVYNVISYFTCVDVYHTSAFIVFCSRSSRISIFHSSFCSPVPWQFRSVSFLLLRIYLWAPLF